MDISKLKIGDKIKYKYSCNTCSDFQKEGTIKYIIKYNKDANLDVNPEVLDRYYINMDNGDCFWAHRIIEKIEDKSINTQDLNNIFESIRQINKELKISLSNLVKALENFNKSKEKPTKPTEETIIDKFIKLDKDFRLSATLSATLLKEALEKFRNSKSFSFEGYMNSYNHNIGGVNYNYQITLGFIPNTISNPQELPKCGQKYKVTLEPIE